VEALLLELLFLLALLEAEAFEDPLFFVEAELVFFWEEDVLLLLELLLFLFDVVLLLPVFFFPDASAMDQK
jgi:hypothetical protein